MSGRYQKKYNTICHTLLANEELVAPTVDKSVFDKGYALLDDLIDRTSTDLAKKYGHNHDLMHTNIQDDAQFAFEIIENNLTKLDCIVVIKTNSFLDCFRATTVERIAAENEEARKANKEVKVIAWTNANRVKPYLDNPKLPKYPIDCDLSSSLYLGVAEALLLPVRMVESPDHMFVRWRFTNNDYMNWDTNEARVKIDDEYRNKPFSLNPKQYLHDLSRDEVIAYHQGTCGTVAWDQNRLDLAEDCFRKSIGARPNIALPIHNLAWLLLTTGTQSQARNKEGLLLAVEADRLEPRTPRHLETLACAYAANSMVDKAIEIATDLEKSGFKSAGLVDRFQKGQTCRDSES